MSFEELSDHCTFLVDKYIKDFEPDEIVAIVRGGNIPATIISKILRKPMGAFWPGDKMYSSPEYMKFDEDRPYKIAIIEDLVALGRTKEIVEDYFNDFSDIDYKFIPILVDENYPEYIEEYGLKTSDWIVFPWEDEEKVSEGDRGLFRDRTDKYGS